MRIKIQALSSGRERAIENSQDFSIWFVNGDINQIGNQNHVPKPNQNVVLIPSKLY